MQRGLGEASQAHQPENEVPFEQHGPVNVVIVCSKTYMWSWMTEREARAHGFLYKNTTQRNIQSMLSFPSGVAAILAVIKPLVQRSRCAMVSVLMLPHPNLPVTLRPLNSHKSHCATNNQSAVGSVSLSCWKSNCTSACRVFVRWNVLVLSVIHESG